MSRICLFSILLLLSVSVIVEAAPNEIIEQQAVKKTPSRSSMFASEVWLTPLVLLPGVALLIVSTSARFGQIHTEVHRLLDRPDAHAKILARNLLKRSALFRDALIALYASVGLFALGSLLGGVVNLWRPESLWVVGGATMVGIGCVVFAAMQLIREAWICLQVVVDQTERLETE
ncbi:DUF2721 domain-containing protein [Bremerella sp. P1]|uniref:DUF2721 domain-containing protein n=1 Tax=Bremerella sp. P1 TaxID=3026424 RepID=UPI002367A447|nr:DUF2721 domain-containing protein [Bremerella sp. P1]WDI41563.1 DUF2721 domain-containing protein [Bremerella sp. P1]